MKKALSLFCLVVLVCLVLFTGCKKNDDGVITQQTESKEDDWVVVQPTGSVIAHSPLRVSSIKGKDVTDEKTGKTTRKVFIGVKNISDDTVSMVSVVIKGYDENGEWIKSTKGLLTYRFDHVTNILPGETLTIDDPSAAYYPHASTISVQIYQVIYRNGDYWRDKSDEKIFTVDFKNKA